MHNAYPTKHWQKTTELIFKKPSRNHKSRLVNENKWQQYTKPKFDDVINSKIEQSNWKKLSQSDVKEDLIL